MKKHTKLGQHFLHDKSVVRAIVDGASLEKGTLVLEIGPGKGALTRFLLDAGGAVVAIEKDAKLLETLRKTFAAEIESGALTLIEDDARNYDPDKWNLSGPYTLVANIPYYITGQLFRSFLTTERQPERAVLLIQKEVADRIVARDKKQSLLSLSVHAYAEPMTIKKVSPGAFNPKPDVDSAVIRLDNINKSFFADIDEEKFFELLHAAFAHKRKQLATNLSKIFDRTEITSALQKAGLREDIRAEDVSLPRWRTLFAFLWNRE